MNVNLNLGYNIQDFQLNLYQYSYSRGKGVIFYTDCKAVWGKFVIVINKIHLTYYAYLFRILWH